MDPDEDVEFKHPRVMAALRANDTEFRMDEYHEAITNGCGGPCAPHLAMKGRWGGFTMLQRGSGRWARARHTDRRSMFTPEHLPGGWTGEGITFIRYRAELVGDTTIRRGNDIDNESSASENEESSSSQQRDECHRPNRVVLTFFDGMGCLTQALTQLGHDPESYHCIGVECDPEAREICRAMNPQVDHSWATDVRDVTEQMIADLGKNSIALFAGGPPCGDFSNKRNLPDREGKYPETDQRPGLKGKNGRLFLKLLQIWKWVRKYNPECKHFVENVVFDDM